MFKLKGIFMYIGLVALSVSVLGDYWGANSALAQTQQVTITGNTAKLSFEPKVINVTAGRPVSLTVTNIGKEGLVFEIRRITGEDWIEPGKSKTYELTFKKGTYTFYEEDRGYRGMNGKIIAK